MTAILFFLKRLGFFIVDHWKLVAIAIAVIVLIAVFYRACGPKPAKLDEKQIQESITAIEQKNDAKLKEILVESDVREKQIDANLANAKAETVNAIAESKKQYANYNTSDLAAEIERRSK